MTRGSEEHCRMTVMAARMHHTRFGGGPWRAGFLRDRQSIHVRPQANHAATRIRPAADHADHTRAANAGHDLVDACRPQSFGYPSSRTLQIVEHFGIAMQIATELRQLIELARYPVLNGHAYRPCSAFAFNRYLKSQWLAP